MSAENSKLLHVRRTCLVSTKPVMPVFIRVFHDSMEFSWIIARTRGKFPCISVSSGNALWFVIIIMISVVFKNITLHSMSYGFCCEVTDNNDAKSA